MKIMKFLALIFIVIGLSSCQTGQEVFEAIENDFNVVYADNDHENSVTKNFMLPDFDLEIDGLSMVWESSDEIHAFIDHNQVIITRPQDQNITVTIKLNVIYQKVTKTYDFSFVIIKQEESLFTHQVTVIDGTSQEMFIMNDGATFNEDHPVKEGFIFAGYYTDEARLIAWENTPIYSSLTLCVKWEEDHNLDVIAPVILGARDIYYFIGDTIDYLYGISVIDNDDPNPVLTFDDTEVDLTMPGRYILYYIALDQSDNETIVEVNVIVEEDILAFTTETFETIAGASSSYADGSFTGVNGVVWTYVGMRTDQALDGKALTFGAKQTNYIKANFTGGISKLSIQFSHVFSGSEKRIVDLYINNILIYTFQITSDQKTYEVSGIQVSGNYTLELRNTGGERVVIDNITLYNNQLSQDLKDIESDIKNFSFPTHVMENATFNFLTQGPKNTSISYRFKDSDNPHNSYINLSSGVIQVPIDQQVSVAIEITFTKGNESKTIVKTLILGEGEPITIYDAKLQSGLVKTKGALTGFVLDGGFIKAFLQDRTGAIEVRFTLSQQSQLEVGKAYVIKGVVQKSVYPYIEQVSSISQKEVEVFDAVSVHLDSIKNHLSSYVYVEGILQRHYETGDAYIYTETGVIAVTIKDSFNPFIDQKLGQKVTLTGHVVLMNNTYKIWVIDGYDVEVDLFHQTLFKTYLLEQLGLTETMVTATDITIKTVVQAFNLNLLWSSSHEHILSSSGMVTTPQEETVVTLSYIASLESEVIFMGSIEVTVTAGFNVSGYYQDASGKQGETLLIELTRIISRNYKGISYTATNRILEVADKHPSGQGYLGIYDHVSITSYNKEHVWPQSSFNEASPYKSDMHHLRISNSTTNSTRSNYYFNLPTSPTSKWQVGSSRFFPGDLDKGDVARMLMYMAVRYRNDNFRLIVAESGRTSNAPSRTMGNLAVLYQWHLEDPVDDFERNRNQVIFETQNNRNPFIDHPELFEAIWQIFMQEDQKRQMRFSQEVIEISDKIDFNVDVAMIPICEQGQKRYFI